MTFYHVMTGALVIGFLCAGLLGAAASVTICYTILKNLS